MSQTRRVWVSETGFLGICALLFILSATATIYWSASMSGSVTTSDMPMSDGMSMSTPATSSGNNAMLWMGAPDQTWVGAGASYLGMWVVMMVAMMLPALVPTLLGYRRLARTSGSTGLGKLTVLVEAGYFVMWAIFGAVTYPVGVAVTAAEMQYPDLARWIPAATGVGFLLAGCFQLTAWKSRQLGCCRNTQELAKTLPANASGAWQYGFRLGEHCTLCCLGFMIPLLVIGMMNLTAIVIVAVAITVERLAPGPERIARAFGAVIILVGVGLIIRSLAIA